MNIDIRIFNKLINSEKNKLGITDKIEDSNIISKYKNLKKNNIYVKKIDKLWSGSNKNNKIILFCDKISFIEKNFEGSYSEYLLFIIPRITKLNNKMLNLLFPDSNETDISVDFIDSFENLTESSEENVKENNSEYIQILEININELQSKVQKISDILLPKLNKFEEIIKKNEADISTTLQDYDKISKDNKLLVDNKIEEFDKINQENQLNLDNSYEEFKLNINEEINNSFTETKEKIDLVIQNFEERMSNIETKMENHQKYTKNSLVILESRLSKIIELVSHAK